MEAVRRRTGEWRTPKHLDASAVLGITHGDIHDRDIRHNVRFACILEVYKFQASQIIFMNSDHILDQGYPRKYHESHCRPYY